MIQTEQLTCQRCGVERDNERPDGCRDPICPTVTHEMGHFAPADFAHLRHILSLALVSQDKATLRTLLLLSNNINIILAALDIASTRITVTAAPDENALAAIASVEGDAS